MREMIAIVLIMGAVTLGLAIASTIIWVAVPWSLQSLLHKSNWDLWHRHAALTRQIEQGQITINSLEYWQMIESLGDRSPDTTGGTRSDYTFPP